MELELKLKMKMKLKLRLKFKLDPKLEWIRPMQNLKQVESETLK